MNTEPTPAATGQQRRALARKIDKISAPIDRSCAEIDRIANQRAARDAKAKSGTVAPPTSDGAVP